MCHVDFNPIIEMSVEKYNVSMQVKNIQQLKCIFITGHADWKNFLIS